MVYKKTFLAVKKYAILTLSADIETYRHHCSLAFIANF